MEYPPLLTWLEWDEDCPADLQPERLAKFRDSLTGMNRRLDAAASAPASGARRARGADLWKVLGIWPVPLRLPAAERERAEQAYLRLWAANAQRKHSAEEWLLLTIGFTADSASLPFWREVLSLSRVADTFASRRRNIASAALTRLFHLRGERTVLDILRELATHPAADARARAAVRLVQCVVGEDEHLDDDTAARLVRMAQGDPEFEPRHVARALLAGAERRLPPEPEGGVLAFEVALRRNAEVSRTVEVRAEQSLHALHDAIQNAFGWGHDHPYEFHLAPGRRGSRFAWPPRPESVPLPRVSLTELLARAAEAARNAPPPKPPGLWDFEDEAAVDEDDEPRAEPILSAVGELGFRVGHRFDYLFDFGDMHYFDIRVVAMHPKCERGGKYPRVTARRGKAPAQYPDWG